MATTIPVLMLAILFEARATGLSKWNKHFGVLLVSSNALAFFGALIGMGTDLGTFLSIFAVLNIGVTFLTLGLLVYYGDKWSRES